MPDPLPPDIWFLIWRKRYWVIRRQSDILIAKLVLSTLVVAIVSLLLVGMVHRVVGTVFGIVGIGLTQRWFDSVRSSMRTTR